MPKIALASAQNLFWWIRYNIIDSSPGVILAKVRNKLAVARRRLGLAPDSGDACTIDLDPNNVLGLENMPDWLRRIPSEACNCGEIMCSCHLRFASFCSALDHGSSSRRPSNRTWDGDMSRHAASTSSSSPAITTAFFARLMFGFWRSEGAHLSTASMQSQARGTEAPDSRRRRSRADEFGKQPGCGHRFLSGGFIERHQLPEEPAHRPVIARDRFTARR